MMGAPSADAALHTDVLPDMPDLEDPAFKCDRDSLF
jgi:hypothetical protein